MRQVAYLRNTVGGDVESLVSRQCYNRAGQSIAQWDPRLFNTGSTPNLATVYSLSGQPLKVNSVDAGSGLSLPGLAGETLQRWDGRDHHWRTSYDSQLRVVAVAQNSRPDVETFTYADASADPACNVRGQMIKHVDPAGWLELSCFNLQGAPLSETRTIAEVGPFISSSTYSPLGAVLTQTDAGGHQQHQHYDIAGQLKQVFLQLKDHEPQCVLQDAQYNAAGQIHTQVAGNGIISQWRFDPADGRLDSLKSGKPDEALQQNLRYFYDRTGNVLRIEDHTLTTVYGANQRVDGHRNFLYDSLYRLISASGFEAEIPNLRPGLPTPMQPIDSGRRYGYTEHYTYDEGNNLTTLRHQREGNNFTQHMRIDRDSNRGVRWKTGDPEPDFERHFDRHGNQLLLQEGTQPLSWNAHDELEKVTLLTHGNGLADDQETYLYSQGERVCKRYLTHTRSITHSREVLYLPGLEIHTRDDASVLHVVTLPLAFGNVRCLHWVSGQPDDLEPDQLRYSLDDHLGSSTHELDRDGALISLECYYPFGGTAWWAARSAVEADYKTIRYSGKEMDRSGLYYYGARYYAPWLQRWVSADPGGAVDGLNLYAMVNNNPIVFIDPDGQTLENFLNATLETPRQRDERKAQSRTTQKARGDRSDLNQAVYKHTKIVALSARRAREAQGQILNHRSAAALGSSAAIRTATHIGSQIIAYGAGVGIGIGVSALGSAAGPAGVAVGFVAGIAAKKAVSFSIDWAAERAGLSTSVQLKSRKLDPDRIAKKGEYKTMELVPFIGAKVKGIAKGVADMNQKGILKGGKEGINLATSTTLKLANTPLASELSAGVSALSGLPEIVHEVMGASADLTPEKIDRLNANITNLIGLLEDSLNNIEAMFAATGTQAVNTFSFIPGKLHTSSGDTVASLRLLTHGAINELRNTRGLLNTQSSKVTSL
ncbi:RHS repeat-associated core domain-containing protein [Pseudomonas sp. 3296]|uniref:RHS repeat-associated core domain-containing protein n=1 Tax=Pseudomonas sp. 3296 TaxID=2817753 RepID=UPI00286D4159|nr:RHS repeat-associated core domain-containing protein [Pseudomonas sp. 3296]